MLRLVISMWYCLIIIFFFFFFQNSSHVVFSSSSSARCHPDESSALLQLNATSETFEGHNKSADCCTWNEVVCDEATGHVVGLDIRLEGYSNNITTNSSLFLLRHLQRLSMFSDDTIAISEAAFKALARNLTRLEQLDLSGIDMSLVPLSALMNLSSSLTYLELSECQLRGELPDNVFSHSFPKLRSIDLSSNNLSGRIPFSLLNVGFSFLENNHFSGQVPSTPHNFSLNWKFCRLYLSDNLLNGPIPSWIYEHPYLEWLGLSNNRFTGEIGNFKTPSLYCLMLRNNNLQGVIPRSLFQNVEIIILDLSSNNLTGDLEFAELSKLKKLWHLDLSFNNFLILSFHKSSNSNLESLSYFKMSSCHIAEFPHFLKFSKHLEFLDLSNNQIQGSVPTWLWESNKDSLKFFLVSKNKFSGEIPISICNLTTLKVLDLSYNNFTGNIPRCIGNVSKDLSVLDLRRNNLHGTIFTTIDFSKNKFTGEIPELLGKLKSLKGLNLSHNMLTGILPSSLGNLSNLEWLDLSSNDVIGKIPLELADITFLSFLNLSHNHLEGPIPVGKQFNTFGNESYMGNLDLCGFPLTKTCGDDGKPSPPTLEHYDGHDSSITNGFNWKIVMMGYASGFVIGISIGYMVLYSNGKLSWLSDTILEELQYRTRPSRPKRSRNARRS